VADRSTLRADCARCAALCCVASAFSRSAEFAVDKPAGVACLHLADDFRCSIHDRLRERGFSGCTTYDCFGAGQQVVQHTYAGADWRSSPDLAAEMFRVFAVMRGLHELQWHLTEAVDLESAAPLREQLLEAQARTEELTRRSAAELDGLDLDAHRAAVVPLLRRCSEVARAGVRGRHPDLAGADLIGRDLAGADLSGASLRGASLVGADLRGADLRLADLTGADLRAADVRGTDLTAVLVLSQQQVDATRGDTRTALPAGLSRPPHWPSDGRPDGPPDGLRTGHRLRR
jgi:uncharacterized protein YjbI with pentapeptide repeats